MFKNPLRGLLSAVAALILAAPSAHAAFGLTTATDLYLPFGRL